MDLPVAGYDTCKECLEWFPTSQLSAGRCAECRASEAAMLVADKHGKVQIDATKAKRAARNRAMTRLARAHPSEFAELVNDEYRQAGILATYLYKGSP